MKIIRWAFAALLLACGSVGFGQTNTFTKFAPATGVLKGSSATYVTSAAVAADIKGLWSGTCDATTFLRGDGSCAAPTGTGITFSMPAGFTVSGSPGSTISVTTALNGVLKGTGSAFTTAAAADIYGLWSGTCSSATFLRGDGACASVSAAPGGSNTQVQFNNSSAFGGSSNFTWDNTNNFLKLTGAGGGVLQSATAKPLSLIGGDVIADVTSSSITLGSNGSSGNGGTVTITAGPAATSGSGGGVALNAGNGTGSLQSGGSVSLSAGNPGSGGAGGVIAMYTAGGTLRETINADGGITVGSPTGGDKGTGTLNAVGLYVNGTAVGGGSGTVTSVALTMPTGFSVSGSPVTGSGTLGVTTSLSGVLKGNGSGFTTATSTDILGLWSGTCSSSTFLRGDGACAASTSPPHMAACYATVSGGTPTLVNTSGCSGVSHPGTGHYTVTFSAGFTARPVCTVSAYGGDFIAFTSDPSNSGTMDFLFDNITGGTRADPAGFMIVCLGN